MAENGLHARRSAISKRRWQQMPVLVIIMSISVSERLCGSHHAACFLSLRTENQPGSVEVCGHNTPEQDKQGICQQNCPQQAAGAAAPLRDGV